MYPVHVLGSQRIGCFDTASEGLVGAFRPISEHRMDVQSYFHRSISDKQHICDMLIRQIKKCQCPLVGL